MTAPVNQVADGNAYRVAFVVPHKFNRATVPTPTDPRVTIREVPAQRVAAWRFSGRWTAAAFKSAAASLRAALTRLGYVANGACGKPVGATAADRVVGDAGCLITDAISIELA